MTSHSLRRRLISAGSIAALLLGLLQLGFTPKALGAESRFRPYRGLGSWVDIYDTYQFDHPGETVRKMHRKGVRTLYLETGNYRQSSAIFRPSSVDRFIHAAHKRGIKVVAWYLPGFENLKQDFYRSKAAIRYRTSAGHRFDGFGLDIEAPEVQPIDRRIRRMLRLSRRLNESVRPSYPLGAIIPSPYGMKRVPGYWGPVRDFPFKQLSNIYDVILPMSYFTYRVRGQRETYNYNAFNVRYIRQKTDNEEVGLHLIGGIAGDAGRKMTRGYVRAVREHGILGGGLYAFDSTRRDQWREMRSIPVNPPQSPALPIRIGERSYDSAIGNVPKADRSHPKEVHFRIGRRSEPVTVNFRTYGIQEDEVQLQVNWKTVSSVPRSASGEWSGVRSVRIPAWRLNDDRHNVISFVARGDFPQWSLWGVKNVGIASP